MERIAGWDGEASGSSPAVPRGTPWCAVMGATLGDGESRTGFGELVLVTTDLDARRDMVAALLSESYYQDFPCAGPSAIGVRGARSHRRRSRSSRCRVGALTSPALRPAPGCVLGGQLLARRCTGAATVRDRSAACSRKWPRPARPGDPRLAGLGPDGPHKLRRSRLDLLGRGQFQTAAEAAALRDSEMARRRFDPILRHLPHPQSCRAFSTLAERTTSRRTGTRALPR